MKKLTLIIAIILMALTSNAQEERLFNSEEILSESWCAFNIYENKYENKITNHLAINIPAPFEGVTGYTIVLENDIKLEFPDDLICDWIDLQMFRNKKDNDNKLGKKEVKLLLKYKIKAILIYKDLIPINSEAAMLVQDNLKYLYKNTKWTK